MKRSYSLLAGMILFPLGASALDLAPKGGVRISSLGLGLEGGLNLEDQFSVRLGFNQFQFNQKMNVSYIRYDLDLEWETTTLLADWHPFRGPLRLTGGLVRNNNTIHGQTSTPSLTIGKNYYEGAKLGVDVEFKPIVPYLGLGWEHGLLEKRGLSVNFDLGILFQGSGDVDLTAKGIAANLIAEEDLAYEERQFEKEIEDYKYYPVFTLGISYQF
jgi:hypothetical protein